MSASLDRLAYVHWRGIVPAIGYYLLSAPAATQPIPTAELPAEPTPTVAPVRPLNTIERNLVVAEPRCIVSPVVAKTCDKVKPPAMPSASRLPCSTLTVVNPKGTP